jgi:protoheme IX farnesyltransferase
LTRGPIGTWFSQHDQGSTGSIGAMPNRLGLGELTVVRPRFGAPAPLQSYIALTKPRIIELLLITTVPTMFVAARHVPSVRLMAMTVAGGALAAGGANALNMVYDRDIDAMMERTKNRPLVTGAITARAATVFAVTLEVGAFVLLWTTVNPLSAVLAVSATAFYIGVYTMWLKRSSSHNIVVGGAAGAVPVLVGWSAVTGHVGLAPLVMFGVIFFWTPPHFWALAVRYRDDYSHAQVPMLPSIADLRTVTRRIMGYVVAVWAFSLLLGAVAHLNLGYAVLAFALGAAFFLYAWALVRHPSPRRAMRLFGFSITYLTALFVAMGVDAVIPIH